MALQMNNKIEEGEVSMDPKANPIEITEAITAHKETLIVGIEASMDPESPIEGAAMEA